MLQLTNNRWSWKGTIQYSPKYKKQLLASLSQMTKTSVMYHWEEQNTEERGNKHVSRQGVKPVTPVFLVTSQNSRTPDRVQDLLSVRAPSHQRSCAGSEPETAECEAYSLQRVFLKYMPFITFYLRVTRWSSWHSRKLLTDSFINTQSFTVQTCPLTIKM